ncbi:gluconate 2-dehydrogenase [Fistulifera solaris]|uniref:Gluconate 2-dehydrogenase n=1 Tax=Fistulifera solaris TaxID=1519565 RepID=A0A1Z5K258_FISSO|nr:gluconate 2-dehydrogenase [Fistulifera solaris]|eukprot:GAX20232.1 gluconate 2-dehydrogenase [Fistulifera solaris]
MRLTVFVMHKTRQSLRAAQRRLQSTTTATAPSYTWADPARRHYKFWNRETDVTGQYSYLIEISPESLQREARILALGSDEADAALHQGPLPLGASLLGVGNTVEELQQNVDKTSPNVLFVSPNCPHAANVLPQVLQAFPSIEWVHCRSAGIDFIESEELVQLYTQRLQSSKPLQITNAKGQFSSSLAEYALMACAYFAKNLPLLLEKQQQRSWHKYNVEELRHKTMGIVGYGDIGRAVAKLATVYGMRVVALRRHPFLSRDDPYCNVVYGRDQESLHQLMRESDYIVCSAPSTVETRGMVSAEAFQHMKPNAVFINLGRGPVIDETALQKALQAGRLKGAALDVFVEEPLSTDSPWWDTPHVLISPHNMDQTATFMHEATEFFLRENLPRFLCGEDLLNPVDPVLGY